MRPTIVALVVTLLSPFYVTAQPLADKVPADALIYAGWAGADSMGPGYAQSHLKAVLDESNLPQLFDEFVPKLLALASKNVPADGREVLALVSSIGPVMWKHPSALYIGPADLTNKDQPSPRAAFLCDAGADAKALADALNNILAKAGQPPFPLSVQTVGTVVLLEVGKTDVPALLAQPGGAKSLLGSPKCAATLGKLVKDPSMAFFVDAEGLVKHVNEIMGMVNKPQATGKWAKVKEVGGLAGLKGLAFSAGFDGKDWSSQGVILAPGQRTGVLASMMAVKPLSDDVLKAVPKSATSVIATQFDLGAFYDLLHNLIGQADANAQKEFDEGMKQANEAIGFDLRADFLAALGSEWVAYSSPEIGGTGLMGLTVVNRLKDPAKAEKGLNQACKLANQLMAQNQEVHIAFQEMKSGTATIHYLAMPLVGPSWAVADGRLYLGLFPQTVVSAIDLGGAKGGSILDNPEFQAIKKRLGVTAASSIDFFDLPKTAPEGYTTIIAISRYAAMADLFGIKSPPMLIPPLHKLLPHLAPAGSATWIDAEGLHYKSICPFPGSELLGGQANFLTGAPMATSAVMVSIMLPALNSARERANRVKDAVNLRTIGQGIMLYAIDNKGKYPADLGALVTSSPIGAEVFVDPSGNNGVPPEVRAGDAKAQAAWVNAHSDYVYIGANLNDASPAECIVAYGNPAYHNNQGANILYNDGHVEWLPIQRFNEELQRNANRNAKPGAAPAKGRL